MVVIDTNILIDYLRQSHKETIFESLLSRYSPDQIYISALTVSELYVGQSTKDKLVKKKVDALVGSLEVVLIDHLIAKKAGELTRDYVFLDLNDAFIAATAIYLKAPLATLNKKHFQGISDLELADLKL